MPSSRSNPETLAVADADRSGGDSPRTAREPATPTADDETAQERRSHASSAGASLMFRVTIGFAVVTLGFALVLGILATRLSGIGDLSPKAADAVRELILWWGFGAVLISGLLGALAARKIAEPIRRLTDAVKNSATADVPWQAPIYRDYAELESLTLAMQRLSAAVRERERELADSEQKFREAFDLVGIGLTQVDIDGRFLVVNRRFCEMLGYEPHELIGLRFTEITHPDDRAADEQMIQHASTGGGIHVSREKRYMRKDGSILWAQRSGVVVRDRNGRPLYGLGSIEDVSQYHAAQETLRALNASLRAIVETSPLAIYSVTPVGIVTLWNPAAERMFGLAEVDVLGRVSPLMRGPMKDRMLEIRGLVMAGETVHGYEVTWQPTMGQHAAEEREISIAAAPLRGPDNGIVGILVTCSDITAIKRTSRKLDEQLHFTKELLEVIPNPIFYKDRDGRFLGFNRAWEAFFEKNRDEWVGRTVEDLLPADLGRVAAAEDRQALEGKPTYASELVIPRVNGSDRVVVKQITRFTNPEGGVAGIIGVLTDITAFKQVKQALEATEGRFQALTESAMDIVTVLDTDGRILYQSSSVKHMLGYEPADMIGKSQFDLIHRDDVDAMRRQFADLVSGQSMHAPFEFRVQAVDGSWRILESIGKNCLDVPAVRGIIVNTRDVTERRAIEDRIQHLAFHDSLTGLPNRSLMQDRIAQAVSRAERAGRKCAVMFIDIDNFKNINDTLGHDVGDELLCEVARRLTASVRSLDTIARQGGDEFIVLLDELDGHQGAIRVAQKILDALRTSFRIGGTAQHVSGSIGIALFPDDGRDAATLLKNADTAMFHGKMLGKNTYQFFTTQMNIAVKRRAMLESNLRAAVNNGDFALVYQPQIDLNSGEVVALEALLRWQSEDSGTMMPSEFIPLAEETGLINEIGRWVLHEACRQNKAWQDAGLPARRVAINLSARQLADKDFLDNLVATLGETGLDPKYLELEITESQVMRQGEGSVLLLNELATMGMHIAVDDFGTGYSSLSYLKRLPIGKLKIDQSFVRDITVDPNDTAIVVAIINMAKSLELDIIAEGIETAGQLTLLRAKGCGVGQGYYFSVPLTPAEVPAFLSRKSVFNHA